MAAHRALEKMQKEYKAARALVMMVKKKRLDLLLNMLGFKYSSSRYVGEVVRPFVQT